jgi:hypothetical protein
VLHLIYEYPFLLFLYKLFKYIVGLLFQSTELYRIVDKVVLKDFRAIPSTDFKVSPETLLRIEKCIFYSSKLQSVSRNIESKLPDLEQASADLLKIKRFHAASLHAIVIQAALSKISQTYELMHLLNARASTRYDSDNVANERQLASVY